MKTVLFSCGFVLAFGCGSPAPQPQHSTRVVSKLTPELTPIVAANNAFVWSLYGALAAEQPAANVFFSPFSVTAALSMTYAGARGETASEMRDALNIQGDDGAYHAALGSLLADLSGEHAGRNYQLYLANRLYTDQGFALSPDFQSLLLTDYRTTPTSEPFGTDPEAARQDINAWVNDETRSAAPELFPAGSIDDQSRVVLANALYFKADWATGFDPKDTRSAPFHAASGDVPVQMMSQRGTFSVVTHKDVTLAEVDYRDRELSMVFLIPFDVAGLPALESELDADFLAGLLAEAQPGHWELDIPRFDLGTRYRMRSALTTLGMRTAFGPNADFSGISSGSGLSLVDVFHAAYLHVDESGTVAAAATATAIATRSAVFPIVADRPFLIVLRDKLTGAILFVGRVADPS